MFSFPTTIRPIEAGPRDTIDDLSIEDDDTALGSEATIRYDSEQPIEPTGPVVRVRRSSVTRIGRYTILRELGRGGMGQVYEADDPELHRRVAIKVLRDDRNDARYIESFRREAQALAKLVHPNVVTVHDVGFVDGQLFMVMRLVDGKTIDDWAQDNPDPAKIVEKFCQAGRGLAAAHAAGLVHCDFKPVNVFVDREGVAQVGDFGLVRTAERDPARPKRASTIAGTPSYMAPEQFGGEATPASDQFSFCVSLWEVLSGERPFEDISIDDREKAASRTIRVNKDLPPKIARVLTRGLSPRPEDRFPSMDALLAALSPRRGRVVPFAIAGVVVAGGGVALALALGGHDEPAPVAPSAPTPGVAAAAPRKLTAYKQSACAYSPTIEANGDVIFDRTQGDAVDLYRVPMGGGLPKQLTTGPAWEWRAHPGRRAGEVIHLIHPTKNVDGQQIAMLDLATGTDTPVASVLALDAVSTQSTIYYLVRTGREVRTVVGEGDSVLVAAPEGAAFSVLAGSPDGTHLAVNTRLKDRSRALCIVDIALAKLTCGPAETDEARPAFSADSRSVYYSSGDGIRRRDLASGKDAVAIPGADARGGLAVAPDGRSVVWSNCGDHQSIVDPTALDKPVVEDGLFPVLGPKRLAWVRRSRGATILMTRSDGGRDVELTRPDFGAVSTPAIAPDGIHIAFVARAPHAGIHSMSTEVPDNIQLISDDPRDRQPVWIDGDTIAFSRDLDEHTSAIYAVASDGGTPRLLIKDRTLRGASGGKLLVSSLSKLYWFDPKTNRETPGPVLDAKAGVGYLALSPNGQWLMYLVGIQGQEVFRMALSTGKTERVGAIAGGSTARSGAITDDGHVLIGATTWAGDLLTVQARQGTAF